MIRRLGNLIKWMLLLFFGSSIFFVVLYRFVPVELSPLMVIRMAQQVKHGKRIKLVHHWVPLSEMSADLPRAVWASEDQNFLSHNGFDFDQIKSAWEEAEKGGRQRGASTISQQTAKNVFLWPSHSWVRKGLETYFTVLIEVVWSKQRIMEVYLNTIEMGDGIYGADAVAHEHFNTTAAELSRQQCALIAVSLPNPLKMNSGQPSNYLLRRQTWVIRQMRNLGEFPME